MERGRAVKLETAFMAFLAFHIWAVLIAYWFAIL
jgi:hypothetical protein